MSGIVGGLPVPDGTLRIPAGTVLQHLLLAAVVLSASAGWTPRAQRLAVLAVLVPATAILLTLAALLVPGLDPQQFRMVGAGQAAGIHLLLGSALYATPRYGVVLGVLRVVGLTAAGLGSAIAAAAYAFGGGGLALVTRLEPMGPATALGGMLLAIGVVAVGPERWPLRALVQAPSDRTLVGHLLPFVILVPVLGPLARAGADFLGAADRVTAGLAPTVTLTAMVWVLSVALGDHRRLVSEVESRDAQLLSVLDGLPTAVMLRAPDGTLLHINPEGERHLTRLGVGVDAVRASPSSLLDHVEVIDESGRPYQRDPERLPVVSAIRDGRSTEATNGYALPEGGYAWYSVRAAPLTFTDGTAGTVVTLDDVTERQEARHRVTLAERSLRLTFNHAPIGIAVIDPDGRLLQVNAALCDLLGYEADELMAGGLEDAIHPDERDVDGRQLELWLSGSQERFLLERRFRHASGRWLFTQLSVAVVRDDDGSPVHLIAQIVDLTDRRALEEELRLAAVQDPLTGLANRRALLRHLVEARQRQARDGPEIGLLYLDLDDFKEVNDRYGHDVGDRLLVATGGWLLAATRETDLACRLGGDEFAVLCAPVDGPRGLQEIVARLHADRPPSVLVDGHVVTTSHSVGAVLLEPNQELEEALRRADAEMYRSKHDNQAQRP
ncbi:MAG: diguanylate cyclase [Nitriliruptoraceae bacterium]